MPIDVDAPGTPGWWLNELSAKLVRRQERLAELDARFRGDPPAPSSPESASDAYEAFRRKSRTNFAALIVEAVKQRMRVVGFRTGAEADDNGDLAARRIWEANDLDVESGDVHASMLSLGDGYVMVGKGEDGQPVITGEDPRQMVTAHDPVRQRRVRAALKMFADPEEGREFAYLHLPGRLHVASHEIGRRAWSVPLTVRFSSQWDWDDGLSGDLPFETVPVVRFRNRRGVGEFEEHVDLLDRIDHQVFQRMVIATMQAYKQRVLENAPKYDEDGAEIDYGILVAGPDEVWRLPEGAKLWESGQVDLTPVLSAVKDDLQALSAVTQTPFHMLSPESANQSAEGASLSREGQVAKAQDRIARATGGWKDVMSLAFLVAGDAERADRAQLQVLWDDPEQRSLSEIADAASKAQDIPWRTRMEKLWRFKPLEIDRMESERATDLLLGLLPSDAANAQPQAVEPDQPSDEVEQVDIVAKKTTAFGALVRAGVTKESAAATVGLEGLDFLDLDPITLRDDEVTGSAQPPQLTNGRAADAEAGDGDAASGA